MGVFKKLSGNDIRVTPIRVKYSKSNKGTVIAATNRNPATSGQVALRSNFYDGGNTKTDNDALVYNSIRQLYYGAFISQNFVSSGSVFETPFSGSVTQESQGVFSQYDPSFQGSLGYDRSLRVAAGQTISVLSIPTKDFGESIVPGTFNMSSLIDDAAGNLTDGSGVVKANIFYDQGIIVRTDGTATSATNTFDASYTVYNTQYKCTASPNEFNYSLNPTLLSSSNTEYDPDIIDSPDFMPYVTTIGLYNENQELMMVAKLSQPMQLNPYTDTNFIVRLDR
jgi:hypothetical protein